MLMFHSRIMERESMWSLHTYLLRVMAVESSLHTLGLPRSLSLHIRLREGFFTNIAREENIYLVIHRSI